MPVARPARTRWRKLALALALALTSTLAGRGPAMARTGVRPLFEPTDLEMEDTGVAEFDLQFGAVRSTQGPFRAVLPDFELDFGITRYLELDLDGAYAIEGPETGPFSFDHPAPDSLWPCAKIGLFDYVDDGGGKSITTAWALGLQAGPKLPVGAGAHGVGVEGLLLIGHTIGRTHLVLNAGGFADPHPDADSARPVGIELGLDLDQDIDRQGHFSLTGEFSGVRFVSQDPHQLSATLGLAWAPVEAFEISIVGLWGFLDGGDRYGLLLGLSPKIRFFKKKT
jgi:hypothetical protein